MPLITLSGTLGKKRAAHLLRRACFGGSVNDIDQFSALTAQEAFALLLREDLPAPPLPVDPSGQEWISTGPPEDTELNYDRLLNAWMVGQMLATGVSADQKLSYSFRERIIFFFHTLITTKTTTVNNPRSIYYQNQLFRFYAFDQNNLTIPSGDPNIPDTEIIKNIKELTKKISVDNAMLKFLDGRLNVKGSPNENYARELLELYSIGKGLEGNVPEPEFDGDYTYFTEQDVQEAAKILSGFDTDDSFLNLDPETNLPRGVPRGGGTIVGSHDNSTKTFSQRFQGAQIAADPLLTLGGSPTEESVLDEISQLIDLIYNQTQTPIHICRKIYRYFVYHQVSNELENDIISDMADIFIANDYKIIPVLEALFTSEHFYDGDPGYLDDNIGSLIKSPLDMVLGFAKIFEIPVPDYSAATTSFFDLTSAFLDVIDQQGMDFYEPFEVAGYPAYHQFPIYNRHWITPNYLTNRYSFIGDRIPLDQNILMGRIDILLFVQDNIPNAIARDAKLLIIEMVGYFLPVSENLDFNGTVGELTNERLNYFLNRFFSDMMDGDPEASWTADWESQADLEKLRGQLTNLANAMLQTPEYQLM